MLSRSKFIIQFPVGTYNGNTVGGGGDIVHLYQNAVQVRDNANRNTPSDIWMLWTQINIHSAKVRRDQLRG